VSYLVDSDWIVDALAGVDSALKVLEELSEEGLAVSIISVGEILEGAYGFPDPDSHRLRFRQFLSGFNLLDLSEPVMEVFARIRSELRREGQLIPDFDLLIAATALHHNLVLVTRNTRHFSRIPGLRLYQSS